MPLTRTLIVWLTALILLGSTVLFADAAPTAEVTETCAVVDIDHLGFAGVEQLKATPGSSWWLEMGHTLWLCGSEDSVARVAERRPLFGVYRGLRPRELAVALMLDPTRLDALGATTLVQMGKATLIQLPEEGRRLWVQKRETWRGELRDVIANSVVGRQLANSQLPPRRPAKANVPGLVDLVDTDRWFADITTLAAWDRYTHRSDILLARTWLVAQLEAMPGLEVSTSSFNVYGTTAFNVMGVLEGFARPDDWYVVSGHYDSINTKTGTPAPGAEDNASGCAGVLELARIFTAHPPEATMIFMCYAGEEQGLYGSYHHADTLISGGDDSKIQGVLNMDMIGYSSDATYDGFIESYPFASDFYNAFTGAAPIYAPSLDLTIVDGSIDHPGYVCCSDHMPYLEEDMPAILLIDDYAEYYGIYHTSNDTPDKIVPGIGEQMLRLGVGTMAELVGADADRLFADGFEGGTPMRWTAVTSPLY